MSGFLVAAGMLLLNVFGCGAAFLANQSGLLPLLALSFFILYGVTAYMAGRGVEFRSPVRPRAAARPQRARQNHLSEFGSLD